MKTTSPSALQFSGYPLRIIEDNVCYAEVKNHLKVVEKKDQKHSASAITPNVNDPKNWDADWFGSYE